MYHILDKSQQKTSNNIISSALFRNILDEDHKAKLAITDYLIRLSSKYFRVFPSQECLSKVLGIPRRTLSTHIAEMKKAGWLIARRKGYNQVCVYRLNPIFFEARNYFKYKFPALKIALAVIMLRSAVFQGFSVTSNLKEYIYTENRESLSVFHAGYPTQEASSTPFFIKNSISSFQEDDPLWAELGDYQKKKEIVMNRPSIQLLVESFNPSELSLQILETFSEEALQYGIRKYFSHPDSRVISDPLKYISTIAKNYARPITRGLSSSKGKQMSYPQKKVVNGTFNANHSPSEKAPNMSGAERIEFLTKEITSLREKIENPEKFFLQNVNLDYALAVGRGLLAAREKELDELLNPHDKLISQDESQMTPGQWLIWNRERRIQRMKGIHHDSI